MISSRTLLLLLLVGCDAPEEVGRSISAVVHDEDDRVDVYAHPDTALAAQARASVVALVPNVRLELRGTVYDIVGATELGERHNLCPDERFGAQPTAATCSGTLVDDDLVLTAGHCMIPQGALGTASCTTTSFVFDFLMQSESALETIDVDDVYTCRAVVAHRLGGTTDYALVKLDRPVVGRTPAPVRRVDGPLPIGMALVAIGFPTGLPMKIDDGGRVFDPGPASLDYFISSLDAFRGNSGSGVRDPDGAVIGIVARTSQDDYSYDGDARCYRVAVAPEARASLASSYVDAALDDLCDTQRYPSERLCGIAPACGDGFCSTGEPTDCEADCPALICGDGVCEPTDDERTCPYDCGATIVSAGDGGGCSVTTRDDGAARAALLLVLAVCFAGMRRRRLRRCAVVLGLAAVLSVSKASAQARIHPWGLRFVGTIEGHRDRVSLTNDVEQFGRLDDRGVGLGLRVGADMGLGRFAGIEATAGAHGIGGFDVSAWELSLAPRLRAVMRPRHELYLRAPLGVAWQVTRHGDVVPSLLVGAGAGYRFQLTRVVDAFFELDFVGRFGGPIAPYSAYAMGYPLHPSSPPDLRTTSLSLRFGVGLGRGYRPVCDEVR